jgi:hypothetical protein
VMQSDHSSVCRVADSPSAPPGCSSGSTSRAAWCAAPAPAAPRRSHVVWPWSSARMGFVGMPSRGDEVSAAAYTSWRHPSATSRPRAPTQDYRTRRMGVTAAAPARAQIPAAANRTA